MEGQQRRFGGLVATLAAVVLAALAPAAARADQLIRSSGPLDLIHVGQELDCQAAHVSYFDEIFWRAGSPPVPAACGTWINIGDTTYGPAIPGTSPPIEPEPYLVESQTSVLGSGTPDDPFAVVTIVAAGSTGIELLQIDTYVIGDEAWRTAVTVFNNNDSDVGVSLYRFGDCFLRNRDDGFGLLDLFRGTVACRGANSGGSPTTDLLQWVNLVGVPSLAEGDPPTLLQDHVGTGLPFPDDCNCANLADNGGGMSWTGTVPAGSAKTAISATNVSPAGNEVLYADLVASPDGLPEDERSRFTFRVENTTNQGRIDLDNVVVQLPPGASYVPGSTRGTANHDPAVNGRFLNWGAFFIDGVAAVHLEFVVVMHDPGLFVASGFATSPEHTVVDRQANHLLFVADRQEPEPPAEPPPPPPPDAEPPETTLTGSPGARTTDRTPTFTFTASESDVLFQCRIDGLGGFAPCTSPLTTPVQAIGGHTFEVRAVDAAGNVDPTPAALAYRIVESDDEPLPPPVPFESMNVERVEGRVLIGVRAGGRGSRARAAQSGEDLKGVRFVPLTSDRQVPIGSFLDTSRGEVQLTTAARSAAGQTQTGRFFGGVFQVLQQRASRPVTEVRLKGSSFARCGRGRGSANAAQSRRRVRRLWGNGRGRFRTRGRYAAATVRGTRWLVEDRCDGTLTRVTRGSVVVRDLRLRRNITVRAGRSYLARARRR